MKQRYNTLKSCSLLLLCLLAVLRSNKTLRYTVLRSNKKSQRWGWPLLQLCCLYLRVGCSVCYYVLPCYVFRSNKITRNKTSTFLPGCVCVTTVPSTFSTESTFVRHVTLLLGNKVTTLFYLVYLCLLLRNTVYLCTYVTTLRVPFYLR